MAITREKKEELVEEYRQLVETSRGLILSSFSGLTVRATEDLRGEIRKAGGEFHIVKNSLIKLAMEQAGVPVPDGSLEGTTAIGFAEVDIPRVAKAMVDLATDARILQIKAGIVEGQVYDAAQIRQLAELPPLPEVRAQLLALIKRPSGGVVHALSASVQQVVNVVKAYSESEVAPSAG